jgi:ABC-type lipoprotein release transport system permease subunit
MPSALLRKSLTDLTRRKARAAFTILTLAIAVASIGIFALPSLSDQMMRREISSTRLADVTVRMKPLPLGPLQLAELRRLPNVTAVDARAFFATRAYVGDRRVKTYVIGIADLGRQRVDVVHLRSGALPGADAALTDVQDARRGRYDGRAGDALRILAGDGSTRTLRITGEGRSMASASLVSDGGAVVVYTTPATVAALSGTSGFSTLAFRLRDTSPAAANATVADIRDYLDAHTAFSGFADLPTVRAPGDWPGRAMFQKFSQLLYVLTALALVSALVLIFNTMSTLIGEQTREIGQMKAIGGTGRQIAGIYLRTALLLGAIASMIGVALGIALANLIDNYFGALMYGTPAQLAVDLPVLLGSVVVGLVGPMVAALPAIWRAVRMPVRDALGTTGTETIPPSRLDGILRHAGFLPRTAQIGVRSVGRRKRRSLATAFQIAFAVATLLAVLGLGASITKLTHDGWREHAFQVWVGASLQQPLDARAAALIRATPGVAKAEPAIVNDARVGGKDGFVWGMGAETGFRYRLTAGRWFTPTEDRGSAPVTVIEHAIAQAAGVHVGDDVRLDTATGPVTFRVIGIARNVQENGMVAFVPLTTLRDVLRTPDAVNAYWVSTTSQDHGVIDATTTRLEDALAQAGFQVGTEITYVGERENVAANRSLSTTITVLGFLVVAISMIGLVSAITMSVIERTREIGVLRCLGARAADIRRIFATEGLLLALAGWLAGIPLGYALTRLFGWLIGRIFGFQLPFLYPPGNVALALVGTLVLALLLMRLPLRRAVRFRPGDALRYA